MCPVIIHGWFPSFCISNFIIRTKAFNFWRIFTIKQKFGISTRNKMGWAKYAWKRRTTPIYIYIILQKGMEKLWVAKTSTRYYKSTTYHLPPWRIQHWKCVEEVRNMFHLIKQSLYSTESFSIRDLFLWTLLAPTNITTGNQRWRPQASMEWQVIHEPRINPQAHGVPP